MDGYYTVSEIAKKWEISERGIRFMCKNNKIPGATKLGNVWAIPCTAVKPADGRIISGKYIDWRKTK